MKKDAKKEMFAKAAEMLFKDRRESRKREAWVRFAAAYGAPSTQEVAEHADALLEEYKKRFEESDAVLEERARQIAEFIAEHSEKSP